MAEWDYANEWGATYDPWYPETTNAGGWGYDPSTMAFSQNPLYEGGTPAGGGWGYDPATGQFSQAPMSGDGGDGGGNWLQSILGSLGGLSGVLGPALSAGGALAGGAIGSNASNDAARLQSDALNRGIDLQTAQWLQQQQNLAPYLQAGRGGLSQLQQLAGREQPAAPGATPSVRGSDYGMPSPYPGWQPRQFQRPDDVNAANYAWNPQQGPQAANYRYTPGDIPQASQYRYTPGAVPTLSGQELLANDPGVQFRMDEGRKALEASAAAKGGLLSGGALAALQRQGQELGSQEYGAAWNRASQQAQLREGWAQTASQMGWGQAESEARLREQVNQIASQQGWSQAQAEAVFREQMAQQSSSQNFNQALAGQQNAFNQGLSAEQWAQKQQEAYSTQLYDRQAQQAQQAYGRDVYSNATDYDRSQAAYRQRMAQHLLPWEQASTLANLGGQATGMFGQQGQGATNAISNLLTQRGSAQAGGATNQANSWMNALQNVGGAVQGGLANQQLLSVLANLNR